VSPSPTPIKGIHPRAEPRAPRLRRACGAESRGIYLLLSSLAQSCRASATRLSLRLTIKTYHTQHILSTHIATWLTIREGFLSIKQENSNEFSLPFWYLMYYTNTWGSAPQPIGLARYTGAVGFPRNHRFRGVTVNPSYALRPLAAAPRTSHSRRAM
jgi:hypothetical protein